MNDLKVYASPLPFSNKQVQLTVPLGATIQDIVNTAMPSKYSPASIGAVVMINGEIIPQEYWGRIRPKAGPHNLAVRIVPQGGGGGGGKNPIAAILSIAVLVAAPYLGSLAAFSLAGGMGPLTAGQLLFGKIVTAGIGIIGSLAVNALAPPPKPSNSGYDRISNPSESPTQFIEGASNAVNRFGVIPVNLGTNRIFPPQAALPYTETQNNDQYVRQLFTYGYGTKMVITDLKIGESSLSDFSDFELEHKLDGDLHETTAIYSNDVFQDDFSILLSEPDGYTTRTTQVDSDEAIVDVTFPSGLCSYNSEGSRNSKQVQLELQYAESGSSPQTWSPASTTYKTFSGTTLTHNAVTLVSGENTGTRIDAIVVNKYSGVIAITVGNNSINPPSIGGNDIRLASVKVVTTRNPLTGALSTDITVTDVRSVSLFGTTLENSSSFLATKASYITTDVSGGGLLVNDLDITGNQKEALRKSVRIKFPVPGQYDLRIRRLTDDSSSDQIFDDVYLTAIKSIKYQAPVNLSGLNGTAVRIKATDQLNGSIGQFNVVASTVIPDYDSAAGAWVDRISSNPASLYRYVLQGAPNGKALEDNKINITDLEEWHILCESKGYTYNRVIDYDTSVDEVLRDICSAGAASPAIVDGKRTVAVDTIKDDVVQIITPRNSWSYSGEMLYPELPHAFRVQFRNAEKGYMQDERIVYDDGYDEDTATKFEVLEIQSCTNSDLAFKNGRRHLAGVRLRPETHSWMMDVEHLVALRGNRVKLEHDVPIIGIGDGRIKTVSDDGNSPALVTGITIDDTVAVPSPSATYYVRIRLNDGTQIYKELINPGAGDKKEFTFATPFPIEDSPSSGDLCYFVEAGGELDLIITRIEPQDDLTARITAIDYAQPYIEDAEESPIPAFNSKISTPLDLVRPSPPILLNEQSNEQAMLANSDGSFTPRAIFTLQNNNYGDVFTQVKIRVSGTSFWTNADVLENTPERLVLTGLNDGQRYDIHIRYKRSNSNMISRPLELNNYLFIGASGNPSDPTGFKVNIDGGVAYFEWNKNTDIDHNYSTLKFSNVFSGASWATAQVRKQKIYETQISLPFLPGTYLLKHVDFLGNESDTATAIITYDPGTVANAIAVVDEFNDSPALSGSTDNVDIVENKIILADTDLTDGYYYFNGMVDLTGIFPCNVSAIVVANGTFANNLFNITDLFAEDDLFGAGGINLFDSTDLFAVDDLFGIGNDGWAVELQYRTTQTDPNNSPADWSDWAALDAGTIEFWAIQFRIKLTSLQQNVSPQITQLSVKVDMPDRIERGDDLTALVAGTTVTFSPEFKEIPAVAITIQDGDVDDRIEFVSKTAGGFTFKVYNGTSAAYVERTFDYIASGYGRKNT